MIGYDVIFLLNYVIAEKKIAVKVLITLKLFFRLFQLEIINTFWDSTMYHWGAYLYKFYFGWAKMQGFVLTMIIYKVLEL